MDCKCCMTARTGPDNFDAQLGPSFRRKRKRLTEDFQAHEFVLAPSLHPYTYVFGKMPSRFRRSIPPRVPPPSLPVRSSHSTTSGSSSLSPIKSGISRSATASSRAVDPLAEGSSRNLDGDTGPHYDVPEEYPGQMMFHYSASVPDISQMSDREMAFKVARFMSCVVDGCLCSGLEPPKDADIALVSREHMNVDQGMDVMDRWRTEEGWWRVCGRCRHGWENGIGHVLPEGLNVAERTRRSKVVGRIEEILQVGAC